MRNYNYCCQHFRNLLNMDLRQNRPSYDYKSSFWPLARLLLLWWWLRCAPGIIIIIIGMRNYAYCRQHFWNLLDMDLRQSRLSYYFKSFSDRSHGLLLLLWWWLWCAPGIIIIIIVVRNYDYCRQHFWKLLNMDLRQRRASYDYKPRFGPLAGIMIIMIVVRARNYNYNCCGTKLWLLSPAFQKNIEYGYPSPHRTRRVQRRHNLRGGDEGVWCWVRVMRVKN